MGSPISMITRTRAESISLTKEWSRRWQWSLALGRSGPHLLFKVSNSWAKKISSILSPGGTLQRITFWEHPLPCLPHLWHRSPMPSLQRLLLRIWIKRPSSRGFSSRTTLSSWPRLKRSWSAQPGKISSPGITQILSLQCRKLWCKLKGNSSNSHRPHLELLTLICQLASISSLRFPLSSLLPAT